MIFCTSSPHLKYHRYFRHYSSTLNAACRPLTCVLDGWQLAGDNSLAFKFRAAQPWLARSVCLQASAHLGRHKHKASSWNNHCKTWGISRLSRWLLLEFIGFCSGAMLSRTLTHILVKSPRDICWHEGHDPIIFSSLVQTYVSAHNSVDWLLDPSATFKLL